MVSIKQAAMSNESATQITLAKLLSIFGLVLVMSCKTASAQCGSYSVSPGGSTGLVLFTTTFSNGPNDLTQPAACYLRPAGEGPIVQTGTFTYSVTSFAGFANSCPSQTFTFTNFFG